MSVILATGCATSGSGSYCQLYRVVYTSPDDEFTLETAEQILGNNEVWKRLCLSD